MVAGKMDESRTFDGSPIHINTIARMYGDPAGVRNFLFDRSVEGSIQGKPFSEILKLIEKELKLNPV